MDHDYTFETRAGEQIKISAESYTDALTELADRLGVTLVSGKIAPRKPATTHYADNVIEANFSRKDA